MHIISIGICDVMRVCMNCSNDINAQQPHVATFLPPDPVPKRWSSLSRHGWKRKRGQLNPCSDCMSGRPKTHSVMSYEKCIEKEMATPGNECIWIHPISAGFWEELQLEWESVRAENIHLCVLLVHGTYWYCFWHCILMARCTCWIICHVYYGQQLAE